MILRISTNYVSIYLTYVQVELHFGHTRLNILINVLFQQNYDSPIVGNINNGLIVTFCCYVTTFEFLAFKHCGVAYVTCCHKIIICTYLSTNSNILVVRC